MTRSEQPITKPRRQRPTGSPMPTKGAGAPQPAKTQLSKQRAPHQPQQCPLAQPHPSSRSQSQPQPQPHSPQQRPQARRQPQSAAKPPAGGIPQRRPRSRKEVHVKRTIMMWRSIGGIAFAAIMLVGCVVGFLGFARPSISEAENRTLTTFPEFTMASFLDGSYFSQLSLWYSDTYPLREPLVQAGLDLKSLYGFTPETRLIGGNRVSDQIPPVEDEDDSPLTAATPRDHNVAEPDVRVRAANIEDQIVNGLYVTNSAAYTLYYFDKDATQAYADVINKAAELLDGKAKVYSILLPTNAGVMLDDAVLSDLGVPNQDQAIDYFYSRMNDNVITVPTFDTLYDHRDEYLYFRTDHHWTQLAAWYVFESFCETAGKKPADYDSWEELVFQPFVGEYSGFTEVGSFIPDSVVARKPQGVDTMTYWADDLNLDDTYTGPIITDLTDADEGANKYNCFVCGNRPMSYIENPNVTDESSCLVIKDSFGNPLVSTMVDNYQYIWTLDFRFTNQKLVDMVEEHHIQDVIFENVLMFAGTYDCSDLLATIVYPSE